MQPIDDTSLGPLVHPAPAGPAPAIAELSRQLGPSRCRWRVRTRCPRARPDRRRGVGRDLAGLFDAGRRFSAEDSLPEPSSKLNPAVYLHAGHMLGVGPADAVAIEESVNGARSTVAAGYLTIGIPQFTPIPDR